MRRVAQQVAMTMVASVLIAGSAAAQSAAPVTPATETASGVGAKLQAGAQRAAQALVVAAGDAWAASKAALAAGAETIRAREAARDRAPHASSEETLSTSASLGKNE